VSCLNVFTERATFSEILFCYKVALIEIGLS
jgi:hypothetical protein